MSTRLFSKGLRTAVALGSAAALLSLAGCQADAPTADQSDGRDDHAPISVNISNVGLFSPQADVITVAPGANQISIAELVSNDGDALLETFALVRATSVKGADLTITSGGLSIEYTPNSAWAWDSFEYTICEELETPESCTTAQVQLVIQGGASDCSAINLTESFRSGSLAPSRWNLNAPTTTLTAAPGGPDGEGDGWLRLTPNQKAQQGYALFSESFKSGQGVSISFEVATWGGTNADGLLFFLIDSDYLDNHPFELGYWGGSLGYAQYVDATLASPLSAKGMPGAVIGLGFDEYGNFPRDQGKDGITSPVTLPNNIALRGGASTANPPSASQGWNYLRGTADPDVPDLTDMYLSCPSEVPPLGQPQPLCVERPSELGPGRYLTTVNIIPQTGNLFEVSVFTQSDVGAATVERLRTTVNVPVQENLQLGFTASTGDKDNNHEIRDLRVSTLTNLSMLTSVPSHPASAPVVEGEEVTYTFNVKNLTGFGVCAAHVALVFPEGFVATAQSCTSTNAASGCGSLDNLGVSDAIVALASNEELLITVTGTITGNTDALVTTTGRVTPRGGQGDLDPSDNFHSTDAPHTIIAFVQDHAIAVASGEATSPDLLDGAIQGTFPIAPATVEIIAMTPTGVTTTISATGVLTVTTTTAVTANFTIQYRVKDDQGHFSNTGNVYVEVNTAPVIANTETWVAVGTAQVEVPLAFGSEPLELTVTNAPAGSTTSVASNDKLVFTPSDVAAAQEYPVIVKVCDKHPTAPACSSTVQTVVYNDLPSVKVATTAGFSATVPSGSSATLPFTPDPNAIGAIDTSKTTLLNPPAPALGTCALAGNEVTFTAIATTGQAFCTVQVCEQKPANHCSSAVFTFNIVPAFTPTKDDLAGAQGVTSTVAATTLLSNDGNVTPSSFALVAGSAVGGTISLDTGTVSFVPNASATSGSFQYKICAGYNVNLCEFVDVDVTITAKPTLSTASVDVWTLINTQVTLDTPFVGATTNTANVPFSGGVATIVGGNVVVTPNLNFIGVLDVPVEGCTLTTPAACATATVKVTVNDLPTMEDEHRLVVPGQQQTIAPDASFGQVGALLWSTLKIKDQTTPNGDCSIDGNSVKYTADASAQEGQTDRCLVELCEEKPVGACVTATFTFEINASFNPTDDGVGTTQDVPVDIKTFDLLSNDGGALNSSFALVGTPDGDGVITLKNGTLAENEDGDGFIYTPDEDFVGTDSFDYTVCSAFDASICEDVTVTITVNSAPAATGSTTWVVTGTPSVAVDLADGYVGEPIKTVEVLSIGPKDDDGDEQGTASDAGSLITFVPNNPSTPIVYELLVEVCDTAAPSACVQTTVTVIYNDPPIASTPTITIPDDGDGDYTIPFDDLIEGTTQGEIEGGWDQTSISVSSALEGPFTDNADLSGASCSFVEGELIYTVAGDTLPTCFMQICEFNPGPAGVDPTERACAVIELTPELGDPSVIASADVVITGPANNTQTSDATPIIRGTGEPGTTVTITVDGTPAGTATVRSNGSWVWTPDADLALGQHTIAATGENGSKDQVALTVVSEPVTGPDPDVVVTGGRAFSCASTGNNAPAPFAVLFFVGLGIMLRRRANTRS